jgi:hypothetical protein
VEKEMMNVVEKEKKRNRVSRLFQKMAFDLADQ